MPRVRACAVGAAWPSPATDHHRSIACRRKRARRQPEALLDQITDELDADAGSQLIGRSEDNPQFLVEMAALPRERGVGVFLAIEVLLAGRLLAR